MNLLNLNKYIAFSIFIMLFPLFVHATVTTKDRWGNVCANYKTGNCAFCVYEYKDDYKAFKLALVYKSDQDAINDIYYVEHLENTARYDVVVEVSKDITKDEFYANNTLKCPDIYYTTELSNVVNTSLIKKFIIKKENGTKLISTGESKIVEQKKSEETTNKDKNENSKKQETTSKENNNTHVIGTARLKYDSLCTNENIKDAMRIIGYVIQVIRWIVPLMLIVLGMVDFGKAAISSDEKAISKASSTLLKRFVAGLIVFFIPTLVMSFLSFLEITNGIEEENNEQFGACTKCLFAPYNTTKCPK